MSCWKLIIDIYIFLGVCALFAYAMWILDAKGHDGLATALTILSAFPIACGLLKFFMWFGT